MVKELGDRDITGTNFSGKSNCHTQLHVHDPPPPPKKRLEGKCIGWEDMLLINVRQSGFDKMVGLRNIGGMLLVWTTALEMFVLIIFEKVVFQYAG